MRFSELLPYNGETLDVEVGCAPVVLGGRVFFVVGGNQSGETIHQWKIGLMEVGSGRRAMAPWIQFWDGVWAGHIRWANEMEVVAGAADAGGTE